MAPLPQFPALLMTIFELTYLTMKRRSVNFCGMQFDQGVRVRDTMVMSCLLRNFIRTLALALLVIGLLVNFDILYNGISHDLVGRAGWWSVFEGDGDEDSQIFLIVSLLPTLILILVSFYLSIVLWRYGTESSMVVHSSMCNPWFYPFFGMLALALTQLFDEKLYNIMSNTGYLVYIITVLLAMVEVDKDMVKNDEVANFLVEVAYKGDQVCVAVPSPASTRSRQRDEEVGLEGDDIPQMKVEDEVSQTKAKHEQ
ncbi:hypothetical protein THAOC_04749 [Thalassiosira oceanica]|uniref:Uncharacterized protein n=1 Tax=Thalassiosira oceanica TaxID=159749 RepID=K0TIK0_THAOC|nr:hypothetical protein THAOC_04749 [Thalassiosira oceanica]|eukprot:EJK73616.1 hypothetical protein THAOC_04749 [Thalassiosira oceanica]